MKKVWFGKKWDSLHALHPVCLRTSNYGTCTSILIWLSLQLASTTVIWGASSEFVSSSIPSWQISTVHVQPFREARDLVFCLKVPLDSLLIWASSEGSGETAWMRRLAWTFAARIGDKYQIRLTRPICLTHEYKCTTNVACTISCYVKLNFPAKSISIWVLSIETWVRNYKKHKGSKNFYMLNMQIRKLERKE